MKNQKGISTLIGIIIVVITAAVLFGGVFVYQYFLTKIVDQPQVQNEQQNQNQQQQTENQQTNNIQPIDQTAGWKTYTNTEYGFEIQYPADGWHLFLDTPRGSSLHWMQIAVIAEQDDFAGGVQLYIQSGDVDSWLKDKATHARETVFINGLRAEKFYFGRDPKIDTSFTYVLEKNNLVYVINTAFTIGNKYGISDADISQILSTFKFTK